MISHELPSATEPEELESSVKFEELNLEHLLKWARVTLPANNPVVLPFSGGLDSATLSAFLTQAIGAHNVVAVHVGHSTTQPQETQNALAVAESLGINFIALDLHELQASMGAKIHEVLHSLGQVNAGLDTTSNASMVYAVVREVARRLGGRLCGTLDGAEILTGYFPKESFYGDFLPLGVLLRQEVRQLATLLGLPPLPEQFAVVPGCGSIVEYVNGQAGTSFSSEIELDNELLRILSGTSNNQLLVDFCWKMHHKTKSALKGRSIYFPSAMRRYVFGGGV